MEKTRNYYIDILKGVAIILTVLGHSIQDGSGSTVLKEGLYFEDVLFRFIYSFHMPLFMVISGYLFGFTLRKYGGKGAIKKRAKSLLIPIICWTTIITLIDLAVALADNVDISMYRMAERYIKNILFELWFLWAVLWGSILTLALKKINERSKVLLWGIVVILFVGNFVSIDSWNLHLYKYTIPFFIIGYLWNMLRGYEKIKAMLCNNQKYIHVIAGGEHSF